MTIEMPGRFWGEVVMTTVYLLNQSPTRSLDGKTPHEALYNKKPTVHLLRVFGCVAYMKVTRLHLAKLDPRGLKVVFIGYELGSKAYMLYDPVGGQAYVSRDVVFDKNTFWRWNDMTEAGQNPNQFMVEYLATELGEGGAQHRELSPPPAAASGTPTPTPIATPAKPPEPVVFATPCTTDSMLDANHDDGLVARYGRMEDLQGGGEKRRLAVRELEEEVVELHAISTG